MNNKALALLYSSAAISATTQAEAEIEQIKSFKDFRSADGKCRALAMSGGATYGSWEAGVLWGLTHYGDPADFAWDVVTGVSAGAVNTAFSSVYATGDEVAMTEMLSDQWAHISTHDVWAIWPDHPKEAIWTQHGVLNSDPFLKTVTDILTPFGEIKRRFTVAAVDANSGSYVTFNQDSLEFEEIPQAAVSSSSIPFVWPPQHFKGYVLMDGGTTWNVNIPSAVNECLDMGFDEEDIILDVVICGSHFREGHGVSKSALENFQDARAEKHFYINYDSVQSSLEAYPRLQKRYFFQGDGYHDCPVDTQLDFNNSTTWCLQMAGRSDAQQALNLGQDKIHEGLELWSSDSDLQKVHPTFTTYLTQLFGL